MKKILITDNPNAREFSQQLHPRLIISRKDIKDLELSKVSDVWLDGIDTESLDQFVSANKILYSPEGFDFSGGIDKIRATVKTMQEYTISDNTPPAPSIEDDFIKPDDIQAPEAHNPVSEHELEDDSVLFKPLNVQQKIVGKIFEKKKINAGTISELSETVVNICKSTKLFLFDSCTGMVSTTLSGKKFIYAHEARKQFDTHFIHRLCIRKESWKLNKETGEGERTVSYRDINEREMNIIWENVRLHSTFNSRLEFYKAIPAWDGVPRIETFLKDYYNCDDDPLFFWYFMTAAIGKMISPERYYCPHYFVMYGRAQGTGKSLLFSQKLFGSEFCSAVTGEGRNKQDFFVDCYKNNNLIVMDDDSDWIELKVFTEGSLKSFVTQPTDTFSRKGQQPEEHYRPFIIVRTTNKVPRVFDIEARRQIVFNVHLNTNECRILSLSDEFWVQLRAEAKDYFQKHGVKKVRNEDFDKIIEQNKKHFSLENSVIQPILDYIDAVRGNADKWGFTLKGQMYGTWKDYVKFCKENKDKPLYGQYFWEKIGMLAQYKEFEIAAEINKAPIVKKRNNSKIQCFLIKDIKKEKDINNELEGLEDIPY